MRFILFSILFLLFLGCISGPKTALNLKDMEITQKNDELAINVFFSGDDIPWQASAKLQVLTSTGAVLYDNEFTIKKDDFKADQKKLIKYLKLNQTSYFAYAKLEINLSNQTFLFEQGKKPDILVIKGEALAYESQYLINLDFIENGKKIKVSGPMDLEILDQEGSFYSETRYINEGDFRGDYLPLHLYYNKVRKSFYNVGNIVLRFKGKESRFEIPLRKYNEKEQIQEQEKTFADNAKLINVYIDYAGFNFNVSRAGYYYAHLPARTQLARFDVTIKDIAGHAEYITRDDLYMKDSDGNFYPVYGKMSTLIGPVLRTNEWVNISLYFNILSEKHAYSLYYGDRKIADFVANA